MIWNLFTTGLVLSLSASTVTTQRLENDFTVVLAFIVEENSEYILPHFLGTVDRLSYSKERITLWIRVDETLKDSAEIIEEWTHKVRDHYRRIDYGPFENANEKLSSLEHDDVILTLRQEALQFANQSDYVLFAESDLLLNDLNLIDNLIDSSVLHRAFIVAPLLSMHGKDAADESYVNFWSEISNEGNFENTDNFVTISERRLRGCFSVSLVHSLFLIQVKNSHYADLSFNSSVYKEMETNIHHNMVGFCQSVSAHKQTIMICNNINYGQMSPPVHWFDNGSEEKRKYLSYAIRRLSLSLKPIPPSQHVQKKASLISNDFDMVYIINLKKRPERRVFMKQVAYELGIDNYKFFDAVDGRTLNDTYLEDLDIKVMQGYMEPYEQRTYLTRGEIGCFLSHYFVWKEAQEKGYKSILILEDDAEPIDEMLEQYESVSAELNALNGDWDLFYLGRQEVVNRVGSKEVEGMEHLEKPGYSYWTIAYALTERGINKVLSHNPLSKMIPSDIYLTILYDQHENEEWKSHFSPRDLIALSANPRLIYPAVFEGEDNFVSDTSFDSSHHDEL